MQAAKKEKRASHPITLAIDIGGTGVKCLLLDGRGRPIGQRRRLRTPRPATPARVLEAVRDLIGRLRSFDRVAVGFPGLVENGVIRTAYNLHPNWVSFDFQTALAELTGRPVLLMNDAEVQGLSHVEGQGLEIMITLGTGMGSAVFVNGKVVPLLELGQQRAANGKTYDQLLNRAALKRVGVRRWRRRVRKMVREIEPVWNFRKLYLGGGNARHVRQKDLPPGAASVSNEGGLWGGYLVWEDPDAAARAGGEEAAAEAPGISERQQDRPSAVTADQ